MKLKLEKFLDPEEYSLAEIFEGKYTIPIYQRPYNWGESQIKQLLADIDESYDLYKNGEGVTADECVLFAGTMFIRPESNYKNSYNEYTVVDGQQRITTLTLMLMVILNYLYQQEKDDTNDHNEADDLMREIKKFLWKVNNRIPSKDKPVLTLGNLDKAILKELFDELFDKKDIIEFANNKLNNANNENFGLNKIAKNLLCNLRIIYDYILDSKRLKSADFDFYDYVDYIQKNIKVVIIQINTNPVRLFSIFESINGKGKPLEELDLIKSYIFQNLNKEDYDRYLEKWGSLIQNTGDELDEYLLIWLRTNITYLKGNLKFSDFKNSLTEKIKNYYETLQSRCDVFKQFIDDLETDLPFYLAMTDFDKLKKIGISDKSIAFMRLNKLANYKHTVPLLFKLLLKRNSKQITDDSLDEIVEYASKFILTFQTVCSRESKKTFLVFQRVQILLYGNDVPVGDEQVKLIKYYFNDCISDNGISDELLKSNVDRSLTFAKNKDVAKFILAFLLVTDCEKGTDYFKLNSILALGRDIEVDHILPQSPNENDEHYYYYKQDELMILKNGQDFVKSTVDRIPVTDFLNKYLHKLGNIRLEWSSDNKVKSNKLINLEEFDYTFNTNKCIIERQEKLINKLLNCNFFISTDHYEFDESLGLLKGQVVVKYSNFVEYDTSKFKPVAYTFNNEITPLEKKKYSILLITFLKNLYSQYQEDFVELAKRKISITSSSKPFLSSEKQDLNRASCLADNVYFELTYSSSDIIKNCYKILEILGLEPNALEIYLE